MKFKFFPEDHRSLEILSRMATEIVTAARSIAELLGMPSSSYTAVAEHVHQNEATVADHFFALLTHMRTSFVSALPREDIYELAVLLHSSIQRLESTADLIAAYKLNRLSKRAAEQLEIVIRQSELTSKAMKNLGNLDKLEDYWLDMLRLGHRAANTQRQWLVEITESGRSHSLAQQRDIAEELLQSSKALNSISLAVGKILVKES
ncbi:DUF47 domain-containing protein [Haematomicrobium sanguinis]|uniref:DUF47 domain-containing protein n=1 Tax=Haematomicrobium sanguinis TaxID=479106 RepID=UPI00047C8061|nr:hypothetical protein [Haematomicrobium sanguinis]